MHGIAGGIIAKPDVSTSSPSSQLVSWPIWKHLRAVPLHHSMPGEMAQKLDVHSRMHCTSQKTSLWGELWTIVRYDRLRPARVRGRPHLANTSSRADVVVSDVGYFLWGHFEYASITTNHMSSRNGPTKSMWMPCHGPSRTGHANRFSGWSGPVSAQAAHSL